MAKLVNGNGFPLRVRRILPNDLCPCGSGRKNKKCCKKDSQYFYSKLNEKQINEK